MKDRAQVRLTRERDFRFRVRFGGEGAPAIVTDESPPLGDGAGPDPAALLAAAVGNCLASSLLFCTRKTRIDVGRLEAEVESTVGRNADGRLRITGMHVTLAPEVDRAAWERMGRCLDLYESFCMVTESVRQGIPVSVIVEPRAPRPILESPSPAASPAAELATG